ncbi:acyl-CoA synthetases /AMP-acid ligases II [Aspergillus leporis]|uniref:Acyl-CoA synthetases /AMP-acid ligases II n=1 Tax=Aspergillus leporis TaxID=41062 RepID=A0A5N5X197_9EURO|nr:acyl-CoA synthetases /AMP-acid ligases II [Aspergillus leporis]
MILLKKCASVCRLGVVPQGTPLGTRHLLSSLQSMPPMRRGLLTQSYARGPLEPQLLESTIGDHFAHIVRKYGDRAAIVSKHQNDRLTYAGLDAKSNALARGLESVGVRTGDRVGVMLGNSMEYSVVTYALFKLGAILVPINPSFNSNQVVSALNHLGASHLIISTESNLPRKQPRSNIPLLEHLVQDLHKPKLESALLPFLKHIILVDNSAGRIDSSKYNSLTHYSSVISGAKADELPLPHRNLSPHDIVNIQFTSGTTAMPKAACLSHRSILNNGSQIGDRMHLTPDDIVCCPPPLFHCFGSVLGYMATATHGSTIVFPTESFNARATLKAVQEEKCTALYGVPTMFLEELTLIEEGEISSEGFENLRTGIAAGSSIPAELMKRLHKVLNLTELTICYGMTETSPVSAMTTTDDPIEKRINTVGRLMPHVEAKVVDPVDRRQILPIGVPGELAVSGYLLMKEYWDDPKRTAEAMIADETGKVWMHTGDEATLSPDGYVTITGRIKDLIIRGGENIHPLEIENCLLTCPGVMDVSVVGVPDERYGEVVAAFIIPREHQEDAVTEDKIRIWVGERLSHHLIPKLVFHLRPLETFPKTASGKIQKFKLKEDAIKILKERGPSH